MSAVGYSYDNAVPEIINGLCKAEVIHRRGPRRSFEAVEFAILEWVDWFDNPTTGGSWSLSSTLTSIYIGAQSHYYAFSA